MRGVGLRVRQGSRSMARFFMALGFSGKEGAIHMPTPAKAEWIDELTDKLQRSKASVLLQTQGLKVSEITDTFRPCVCNSTLALLRWSLSVSSSIHSAFAGVGMCIAPSFPENPSAIKKRAIERLPCRTRRPTPRIDAWSAPVCGKS